MYTSLKKSCITEKRGFGGINGSKLFTYSLNGGDVLKWKLNFHKVCNLFCNFEVSLQFPCLKKYYYYKFLIGVYLITKY